MISPRRILYVSGTRADFGLMQSTLMRLHADPRFDLGIVVTGMHLDAAYGMTVSEVERAGFHIVARLPVEGGTPSGAKMARNLGQMITGFVPAFESASADIVLLLGDRGEMLAGAVAALHLNIPLAHIHGGERSGTVDEPLRHAISKLSSLHLVATQKSRDRLIAMGEIPQSIKVVGAPGLDGLAQLPRRSKMQLALDHGLRDNALMVLLVYHPVLQEADAAGEHVTAIIESLRPYDMQIVALKPNSDAGSQKIRNVLEELSEAGEITLFTHLARPTFIEFMAAADIMIGNSSSGIIEAATFGTPVINIGSRQNLRERNANVVDVGTKVSEIRRAVADAITMPRPLPSNVYGDGHAGERIANTLAEADLSALQRAKTNAY